jgi:preprotein translocase subunit YajC
VALSNQTSIQQNDEALIIAFLTQKLFPLAIFLLQEAAEAPAGGAAPAGDAAGGAAPAAGGAEQMFPPQMMMFMVGLFVIFYLMIMRPQQKEARRRKDLLEGLKKNDKVISSGGIIGTIADVSSDGRRVTVKVDDNTRIKFQRSSIQGLYEEN